MRLRFYYIVISAFALMPVTGCKNNSTLQEPDALEVASESEVFLTPKEVEASGIKWTSASEHNFPGIINATGKLDVPPSNRADVSVMFPGFVQSVKIIAGQKVKKGQVLFTLENPEYVDLQRDYLTVRVDYSLARVQLDRQTKLKADNATSDENFQKAESAFKMNEVKYKSLRKKLEMLGIQPDEITAESISSGIPVKAPIDGRISDIHIFRGSHLSSSDVALSIINTDHLHVELQIFEKDLPNIREGQKVIFTLPHHPQKKYKATVHQIGNSIDPETRTAHIHCHLDAVTDGSHFATGQYVDAEIQTSNRERQSLPNDAVVDIDGNYYGLKLIDSTKNNLHFKRVKFELTDKDDDFSAVLLNNKPPEGKFITSGAFVLLRKEG
ncbi:MAG: efflux RND transporter periplasmic adaptor subunit [Bacteroidetes bacterium]|nr:efflux RND transporter periplasmic adaptor subunit [Bacteroidota bacterium]